VRRCASASPCCGAVVADLQIARFEVNVALSVGEAVVAPNVGYHPLALGERLAEQLDVEVGRRRIGYYPALDFFRQDPGDIDPALIALVDEIAAYCSEYAKRELRRRLSRAFSNVAFERVQALCYSMPKVRPNEPRALTRLAAHLAPDQLRLTLRLSSIEKEVVPALEVLAAHKVSRWAGSAFAELEVLDTRPASASR